MAETQMEKSDKIKKTRDALLCFCDDAGPDNRGISHNDFRLAVWERPDLSIGDLCEALNVGAKCTACMLNVESAYYEAYESRPANFVAAAKAVTARQPKRVIGSRRSVKRALYDLVDGIMPLQGETHMEVFPVIAAKGLRTVLTISNRFPAAIGARSAPYHCKIEIRDQHGTIVESKSFDLSPGENLDIDVSAPLSAIRGQSEVVSGACWVYRTPTAHGMVGSTRPHFKLVGDRGVSAVHAQLTNPPITSLVLSRANPTERHFVHLTNVYNDPVDSGTTVAPLSGPGEQNFTSTIPAKGSVLIELPRLDSTLNGGTPIYRVTSKSERPRRGHLLIANPELTMMSADHI
jgi:hypothetical protein